MPNAERIQEQIDCETEQSFSDSDVLAFLEGVTQAGPVVMVRAAGMLRIRLAGDVINASGIREAVLRYSAKMLVRD